MADFCRSCSIQIFQVGSRDMAGLTDPESWSRGLAAEVLCEGCGPIQVDPEGNCVSSGCIRKGKPGHGLPWVGHPGYPGTPLENPPESTPRSKEAKRAELAAADPDDIEF